MWCKVPTGFGSEINKLLFVRYSLPFDSTLTTDYNPFCYTTIRTHLNKNNSYKGSSIFKLSNDAFILFYSFICLVFLPSFWPSLGREETSTEAVEKRTRIRRALPCGELCSRMSNWYKQYGGQLEFSEIIFWKVFSMLHELLLALSGNCGGVFVKKGKNSLQVSSLAK